MMIDISEYMYTVSCQPLVNSDSFWMCLFAVTSPKVGVSCACRFCTPPHVIPEPESGFGLEFHVTVKSLRMYCNVKSL